MTIDEPIQVDEPHRSATPATPALPIIALAIVVIAGLGLWLLVSSSGDADATTTSGDATGTIESPFPRDEPHTLATNILQTKGVADWGLTFSALSAGPGEPTVDGVVFAVVDVQAELRRSEQLPVTTLESFDVQIFGGATSAIYAQTTLGQDCGDEVNTFDINAPTSEDDVVDGTVCIAIPDEDLGHPDTLIAVQFNLGEIAYFG